MATSSSNLRNSPSSKKQKNGVEEEVILYDRISQLPDSVLVQILSLLPTTKDAFTTCILSKRWQYIWTFVDSFFFTITSHQTRENFSFVDYVLAHSLSSKIKIFQLDCTGCTDMYLYDHSIRCEYDSLVGRCLSFAVDRKVENVILWSFEGDACTLPETLCTCSSLITLDVKYCTFDFHSVISWKSLKSIKFGYSILYDDDIVNKLSGCPALETMELCNVNGFSRLEINSLKLKRLKLKDYWCAHSGEDHFLEIFAPYLQHLEISGDYYDLRCRLLDVSSVVNAELTFNIRCTEDYPNYIGEESDDEEGNCHDYHQVLYTLVQDNLQKLSCAAELRIGNWFIEVLCILQFKGVLIPELKCKYLTLELHVKKFNLYGAAGLLRASPHVETLNIDIATITTTRLDSSWCQFVSRYLAKGDNIDLDVWISSFVFPNLKSVKIASSSGVCLKYHLEWGYVEKLFKLSEFLLKNASVLEKFVIISKRRRCKTCSMNCVSQYLFQLAEKLSECTRSSTNFMIIFQE